MGRIWRDKSSETDGGDDQCSTSKVVRSQCKTEEVEPGKFVKKCEKTEEVFRHCVGTSPTVVHSTKEYTEEDVTDQMLGSPPDWFEEDAIPGLHSKVDATECHFFSGMKSFCDAAENRANSLFDIFKDHSFQTPTSRGLPFEDRPPGDSSECKNDDNAPIRPESGHIDISSLTRDV